MSAKIGKEDRNLVKTVLKYKNQIVKRLKIDGVNLICSLSNVGKEEEVISYHLTRLITQELVKLTSPVRISQAYEWKSKLLTSALVK